MRTTSDNITPQQISELRAAAREVGDLEMVAICYLALGEAPGQISGDADSIAECARVIARAERERLADRYHDVETGGL